MLETLTSGVKESFAPTKILSLISHISVVRSCCRVSTKFEIFLPVVCRVQNTQRLVNSPQSSLAVSRFVTHNANFKRMSTSKSTGMSDSLFHRRTLCECVPRSLVLCRHCPTIFRSGQTNVLRLSRDGAHLVALGRRPLQHASLYLQQFAESVNTFLETRSPLSFLSRPLVICCTLIFRALRTHLRKF